MTDNRLRNIAVIGRGVSVWLAAATLSRVLKSDFCQIRVIEIPGLPSDPLSETTNPSFHRLLNLLGINEADLMLNTQATFNLGVEFRDWVDIGNCYFHSFGPYGARLETVPFHQYWIKLRQLGDVAGIEEYSLATAVAKAGRFARPSKDQNSVLSLFSYGYLFHAELLAGYLQTYAENRGVIGVKQDVMDVALQSENGLIAALMLADGSRLEADFYIDCTGPERLGFLKGILGGFEDWSHWLPCDRGVARFCGHTDEPRAYSQALAAEAGWQWQVPLQSNVDNGYAYCSRYLNEEQAVATLNAGLSGRALSEPRFLQFSCGRPERFWAKNYLALAGGTVAPLESVRLQLIQTGIARLLTVFPDRDFIVSDAEEYNRLTIAEHEGIRDFLILHYKATVRRDSGFWEYCQNMQVPDSLSTKIALFRSSGRLSLADDEPFGEQNWLALFLGQNIIPDCYDPLADFMDVAQVRAAFAHLQSRISDAIAPMPTYSQFMGQIRKTQSSRTP